MNTSTEVEASTHGDGLRMNAKQLADALKVAALWAEWESEVLNDFHEYGMMFHAEPGGNVFACVLQDALRYRGLTLERLRAARELRK
jgi:hypothetical protein